MEPQYTLSDIFKHEETIRQYCFSEDRIDLSPGTLMYLASLEPNFDTHFAEYVIFKRLHQIAEYIFSESKKIGYLINVRECQKLKEDLHNNNASKEYYEGWVRRYDSTDNEGKEPIIHIINQAIRDNHWNFLYYLYYKEEKKLNELLTELKNQFNNKKFFIVQ